MNWLSVKECRSAYASTYYFKWSVSSLDLALNGAEFESIVWVVDVLGGEE